MKTIFAVDDNHINLLAAEAALSEDYEVFTLASAEMMFGLLEHVTPDLILLDIIMPEVDGFAALARLKADGRFAEIPVIFLTGDEHPETKTRALEAGAADLIMKPFTREKLLKQLTMYNEQ